MSAPAPIDFGAVVAPIAQAFLAWELRVEAAAVDNIDRGAPGVVSSFRTDRGELKRGMAVEAPRMEGTTMRGAVLNRAPHALVAHEGRRPRKAMPPRSVIAEWAQRKLGLSSEEAKRAAFPIARAIGRRGVAGNPFLAEAAERHMAEGRAALAEAAARGMAAAIPEQTL